MGDPSHRMRIYEAMFLVETAKGRRDEAETVGELSELVQKHGAKVINGAKWNDRDLAYPIHKHHQKFTRGVYFLFHISAPPPAIEGMERDVQISDWIIRALITRDEDGIDNPAVGSGREVREEAQDEAEDVKETETLENEAEEEPPAADGPPLEGEA